MKPRQRTLISAATLTAVTSGALAQAGKDSPPSGVGFPGMLPNSEHSWCPRSPNYATQSVKTPPLGLWRTTTPAIVRSAPTTTAPELAHLPVNAALWLIEVGETWSRVRGRAGAITYMGYIRTESITQINR